MDLHKPYVATWAIAAVPQGWLTDAAVGIEQEVQPVRLPRGYQIEKFLCPLAFPRHVCKGVKSRFKKGLQGP